MTIKEYEHPSFKRAAELEGPLAGHFPTSRETAEDWTPLLSVRALHSCVLCVATTRVEFGWAAYCSNVPGISHGNEYQEVLDHGDKLPEDVARVLFPRFEGVPYCD